MRAKVIPLVLIHAALSLSSLAQAPAAPPVTSPLTQGAALPVISEVSSAVSVDAVLLPYSVAKRAFGKETAQKYAAVSMTISNRDPKQSLIIQSALLDYSHWLFSGTFSGLNADTTTEITSSQQTNKKSQVSSAEVRIVRNQLQDAQLWSLRNWVIRSAVAAGTVSAGLSFASSSAYFANSVSAYSADFVPALSVLWPDNTQAQSDLISDIGFRTNHVVPAQSADIVIAFFPIDRFLTSDLKKIYLKEPAAFFNPSELLLGNKNRAALLAPLKSVGVITDTSDASANTITKAIMDYERAAQIANPSGSSKPKVDPCAAPVDKPNTDKSKVTDDECMIVSLLDRISLNNIHVVIGGIMSIDTNAVPATITGVSIDNDTTAATWATNAKVSATLTGTFLSGGSVSLTGVDPTATPLPGTPFSSPANGNATDVSLPVTFTITATTAIAPNSKLTFIVTKKAKDGSTTTSVPFIYAVPQTQ